MGAAWRSAFSAAPRLERFDEKRIEPTPALTAARPAAMPAAPVPPALPTPVERVHAHREQLFVCAVQLLDDAHAAQQLVSETVEKALLVGKDLEAEPHIERMLDRLLISLALVRLKAMPAPILITPRGLKTSSDALLPSPSLMSALSPSEREAEASEEVSAESQFARTAQVLTSLPVEARLAVTLVVMQGRALDEAAFLLAISEDSCRFFLNHGRKLMRRALQRDLLMRAGDGRAAALLEKLTSETTTLHDLRRSKKATIRA